MERNTVLLVDADADTVSAVIEAAAETHLDLRFARTSNDAFRLFEGGLEDVAVTVLDVDPGVHGMAVLEALDAWDAAHPVIVVSSLEEAYVRPIALAHGAEFCFGKPVTTESLKNAIEKICQEDSRRAGWQCDRWGHPCPGCLKSRPGSEQESAILAECK